MKRVLVIGASGRVGSQVVGQLMERGVPVTAMTRNPEGVAFPSPVRVMGGDLTRPETLHGCLAGAKTVFLVWTAPPSAVESALEQIAKHAERIVFLSAPIKTRHPFFQQPNAARDLVEKIERTIEASGMQWTYVRPGMFAANSAAWWAPKIRAGNVVRWPYLSVPTAPIDERDIAAVAVRALSEEGHAGSEYVITGPESLTQREQIATIGRVLGRSVQIEEISPEEAPVELSKIIPLPAAKMLLSAWAAALGQPAHVTGTVGEVTGVPARSFGEWVADHASEFRS